MRRMEAETASLGMVDYILFFTMLVISASIGIYFRFAGGKQKTIDEYLFADRNMSVLPVAFSMMATHVSAVSVLGIPADMYKYGVHLSYVSIGIIIGYVVSSYLFLPVFYDIHASTAYEYLERRYGKTTRILCSFAFVIQMVLVVSVVLYAPALALSVVMNLPMWLSIVSIGVVCTFYCTLGGMKAVLWTDVFQAILMFICLLAIIIKGCIDDGGFSNVLHIARKGGRLAIPSFSPDFTLRYTMWNLVCQGVYFSMSSVSAHQVQLQRLLTIKTITKSRKALLLSIPLTTCFNLMCCLSGLIIYSHFAQCDPLSSPEKPISSADQLLPYYAMLKFKEYPGLSGLCICGIFSATLSTVSSVVNSLSAVTMQDLIWPFFSKKGLSHKTALLSVSALTLSYGILFILLAFLISVFGNLIQASVSVSGLLGGPVMGVFILGMMTTTANEKGSIVGLLASVAISAWIIFGAATNPTPHKELQMSTMGCPNLTHNTSNNDSLSKYISEFALNSSSLDYDISFLDTTSSSFNTTSSSVHAASSSLNVTSSFEIELVTKREAFILYKISFMWFATIGFVTSVVIGYFASILISSIFRYNVKNVPPEFLSPAVRWCLKNTKHQEEYTDPIEL